MFDRLKSFLSNYQVSIAQLGFGDTAHAYKWTKHEALANFERSLYANKAIGVRAQKVAQVDLIMKDAKGDVLENNEWLELLEKPNPHQTGDQFRQLLMKYYDVVGAAYILKVKKDLPFPEAEPTQIPDALYLLRADRVEVMHDEAQTKILGFKYVINGNEKVYEPDAIIYHYRPDPRNPLLGESLLACTLRAIETETQISEYHNRVIRNGGKIGSVINFKQGKTQEQLDEVAESFEKKYAGAANAGRPFLISGEVDVHSQGMSPKEMDFVETKKQVLNDILIATGVPKPLLGIGSGETYANADAEIATFLRDKVKPEVEHLVQTLNWRLIPDGLELDFIDPTPEDVDAKIKKLTALHAANALTTDEKRELFEYEPTEKGDTILVPFNLMPLTEEKPEPRMLSKSFEHPLKNKEFRQEYGKRVDKRARQNEPIMERAIINYFEGQEKRLMEKLNRKRKVTKDVLEDIFTPSVEVALAKEALMPIYRDIFMESGNATAATFNTTFTPNSVVEQAIRDRVALFTNSIVSTTSDQLAKRIADNLAEGGNRQDLVKEVRNLYGDISTGRAKTIARTEVHTATVNGNLESYRQAGFETKIWVTVKDLDVRDEHQIDGEERGIDQVFSNGELYPGESSINCRCQI